MSVWTAEDVKNAIAEIARRSSVDQDFRKLALSDATAALYKVTSRPVPPNLQLRFVENEGNTQMIVLPEMSHGIEELSEEEVEQVAGGVAAVRWSGGVTVSGS